MRPDGVNEIEKRFLDFRHAYMAVEAELDAARLSALRAAIASAIEALREMKPGAAYAIVRAPDYKKLHAEARARMLPHLETRVLECLPRLGIRLEDLGTGQASGTLDEAMACYGLVSALVRDAPPDIMPRLDTPLPQKHPLAPRLAREAERRVRRYVEALRADMEQPDPPDMRVLAANYFRIELLAWICESAGAPSEAMGTHARVIARLILRRVSRLIREFVADGGLAAKVDLAMALATIDDLLLFMMRVIEGNAEEHSGMAFTFDDTEGIKALEEFGSALDLLVHRYLQDVSHDESEASFVDESMAALQILKKVAILGVAVRRADPAKFAAGSEVETRAALAAGRSMAADRLLATARAGIIQLQAIFTRHRDKAGGALSSEQKEAYRVLLADLCGVLAG